MEMHIRREGRGHRIYCNGKPVGPRRRTRRQAEGWAEAYDELLPGRSDHRE